MSRHSEARAPWVGLVLLTLVAANGFSYADRYLFSILIPAIKAEFGASDGSLGLIGGPIFVISFVALSLPLARLADRWSRRGVLMLAVVTWSVATALCGVAANVVQLGIARALVGAGEAGGMPASQAIVSDLYDDRRRSGAMGVLASSTYLGLVLGIAGGAAIAAAWGWRWAFVLIAAPGLACALLVALLPLGRRERGGAAPPALPALTVLRRCWGIPSLRLLALGIGTFNIFAYGAAVWMPAYFIRSHGMSLVAAGSWLGIGAAVGGFAGSLASGALVDRLRLRGEQWQLSVPAWGFIVSLPIYMAILLLPGGSAVPVGGAAIPTVALLSVLTALFSSAAMGPAFGAIARLVAAEERAQATAFAIVLINVMGSAFGPLLAGLVSDALGARFGAESLRYSLLAMSTLVLAGGLLLLWASLRYPHDLARGAA
ncbi:MFS transporter [Sphingomonas jatrophae]|uniref:Predicted arabinose efflux permease, MFS family n=1 Tax=Sphingomonas jatrophae TaxID=1166337 RepID=A0A1I6KBP5_9SPHN|nr:MFS transporter [Sphingomonas jatrophae]SFR88616.1 Predicted arabinose efflux permease, MFS family [Sphingomonas jatrophae]